MQEPVLEIINQNVVFLSPNDNVKTAASLMEKHNIGCLPVLHELKILGLLTDRDITIKCTSRGMNVSETQVSQIMTKDLVFINETSTVYEALKVMTLKKVMRLPVVSLKEKFLGIISFFDISCFHAGPEVSLAISSISEKNVKRKKDIKTM